MLLNAALVYKQDSKLYLETFLIDNTVTKKGKKVNDNTLDFNVQASRSHPLTLYPKQSGGKWIWDHPVIETNSLTDNLAFQRKYEIGHEIRIKKVRDGCWNAVYEITDQGAKNLFAKYEGQTIPFWTSSGIIHSSKEDPLNIKDWRIIHNAIVSEPANGFEKAAVVDMCNGTESSCSSILTASITPSFTFCTANALENYISSLSSVSGKFPHYTMSSESSGGVSSAAQVGAVTYNPGFTGTNAQTGQGSVPTNLTPPNPSSANTENPNPQSKAETESKQQEQGKEKKEDVDYKAKVKELEDQLKQITTEKQAKENENKTVTERIATLERENLRNTRKNQVLAIVAGYPEAFLDAKTGLPQQELYSKTVLEWIDKNYDDKTINELLEAKTIKWVNEVQNIGNNNAKDVVAYNSGTANDYQRTTMTTASVSTTDSDSSLPIWEKISDLTNARIRLFADKYQKMGARY